MPTQTEAQETGRAGERWFVSKLPLNWVFQPPLDDVGIDGVVVICEPGSSNGMEFRVQIKSSQEFHRSGDMIILRRIKRASVRYWITGFTPTLLVAYEVSTQAGFCAWANQTLASKIDLLNEEDGLCSLELPTRMRIDNDVWEHIRVQLGGLYAALGRNLLVAETVTPFLSALNTLSGSLKALYFAEAARPPEAQRTDAQRQLMSQLEITAHRDVVRAMIALEEELVGCGVRLEGLREYGNEYTKRCSSFIQGFQESLNGDVTTCQVYAEALAIERRPLMNSIAGVINELTKAAVHASKQHVE